MTLLPPNIEISQSSLNMLVEDLQLSNVCARWVPRLLSDAHKQRRLTAAQSFLQLFKDEGEADVYKRQV